MQEIKMPSAGQTTDAAQIVKVNVKPGDTVKRGDVLVEAETDKAVLPVESFAAGTVLAVLVKAGDTVDAGSVLIAIGQKGENDGGAVSAPAVSLPAAAPASAAPAVGQAIKMPSAGQTTDEAQIVKVNVRPGDTVKRGDVLMEAETDKAVLPVESFTAGQVFDVLVKAGDTVTAGSVLAVIGKKEEAAAYHRGGGEAIAAAPVSAAVAPPAEEEEYLPIIKGDTVRRASAATTAPAAAPAAAPVVPAPAASGASDAIWPAMPNAKFLAREKGMTLAGITPANGVFLTRKDVRSAEQAASVPVVKAAEAEYRVLPMTRVRAIIGKRMQESMQNIPAWQCTTRINMTACMALRETYLAQKGLKLSYNDIMARAIAVASRKFDLVNARYEQGEVRIYRHTNVGLAVGLPGALVVPVVRNIDEMGLAEIAAAYKEKVSKAREGALTPDDMGCGSITISNLGMYDVDQFIAIVNPPESCILAVGSIQTEPVWDGKAFRPAPRMSVTGSFDHRIIDGAYGAQFLRELKTLMENPTLMLG